MPAGKSLPESSPKLVPGGAVLPVPEYMRLPLPGTIDPVASLNRTALDKLTRPQQCNDYKPPVRSIIIRGGKGKDRGIRLISTKSLLEYLNSLPNDGGGVC
jgi:hypothetical protein